MTNTKKLSIISLTWPIFLESLLFMLMGNADTLMLSQYSDSSVASVGVANQIISFAIVMFGFVSAGAAVIISQYIGARKFENAKQVSAVALVCSLIFGLVVSVIFITSRKLLLSFMDLSDSLFYEAEFFLSVVGGFIFVQAILTTVGAILRSHGYTRDTLFVTVVMNLLNVTGNALAIFGLFGFPVLGAQGVAFSTVISRLVATIIAIIIMFKRIGNPFRTIQFKQFPFMYVKNILKIGLPAAGENLSYSGYQIMMTFFITSMGTLALTTRVYTQNIMMFIFLFAIAIGQGGQIMIGQLMGAKKYNEIYEKCFTYLKAAIPMSTLGAIIFYFLAEPILSLFTNNQEIISTGQTLLLLGIILEPGRAFNIIIINALRAAGDVKFPVQIGVLSMWGVGVVFGYILGVVLDFGLIGIWIAFIIDEWLRGIIMLFRWRSRAWQSKNVLSDVA